MELLRTISRREQSCYMPPAFGTGEVDRTALQHYLVWRRDMATWLLDTADLYGIRPSTVETAQSMLDRLSSLDHEITEDFEMFQVSCLVCLLIACKSCETRRTVKKSKIRELVEEFFSPEELDSMELHVLYSLRWRTQPPTSIDIAHMLLDIVPFDVIPDRLQILEKVVMRLKIALVNSKFVPFRASSKALASVLLSLHSILKPEPFRTIQQEMKDALGYEEAFERELQQLQIMLLAESTRSSESSPDDTTTPFYKAFRHSKKSRWDLSHQIYGSDSTIPDISPRSVLTEK